MLSVWDNMRHAGDPRGVPGSVHVRCERSLPSRDLRDAHADAHADFDIYGNSHQHRNANSDANAWRERLLPVQSVFLRSGIRRRLPAGRTCVQRNVLWSDWAVYYVYANANRYIDSNPHTDPHRHTDANRHADADTDIHTYANPHEYADADADADPNAHTDPNADGWSERLLSM